MSQTTILYINAITSDQLFCFLEQKAVRRSFTMSHVIAAIYVQNISEIAPNLMTNLQTDRQYLM